MSIMVIAYLDSYPLADPVLSAIKTASVSIGSSMTAVILLGSCIGLPFLFDDFVLRRSVSAIDALANCYKSVKGWAR